MTFEEIEAIVQSLDDRGVDAVEITVGTAHLKLRFGTDRPSAVRAEIVAPAPGRFRQAHPLDSAPRFSEGDAIRAGDVVAFVEANGVLKPVVATADGTLGKALLSDGAPVGWGAPLYQTR
jgi:biotin carboxyl carrier protein